MLQLYDKIEEGRKFERVLYGHIQTLKSDLHRSERTVKELSRWAAAWSGRERERRDRRKEPYSRKGKGRVAAMVAHGIKIENELSDCDYVADN